MRGNINDEEYAVLSRIYCFGKCRQWFPRNITPTDLDARYFVESAGHFLWFEFKTDGAAIPEGQKIAYRRLLFRGRPVDTLIVCEHPKLTKVQLFEDITRFQIVKWDDTQRDVVQSPWMFEAESIGRWIDEWFAHSAEQLNDFVTTFRRRSGIYPGVAAF